MDLSQRCKSPPLSPMQTTIITEAGDQDEGVVIEEGEEGEVATTVTKPRRRDRKLRIRKKTYFPVYRVLKADLSRQYATMLNNCINSGSYHLLSSFASHYMTSDMRYEAFVKPFQVDIPGIPCLPPWIQFSNRQHYLLYCAGIVNTLPDFTAKMSNIQIRTRA